MKDGFAERLRSGRNSDDYFTRAVESVLLQGAQWDTHDLAFGAAHWERAVKESGYVAAQQTVSVMPGQ